LATPTQVRRRARWGLLGATIISTALVLGALGGGAFGAAVDSASFSGAANTVEVGGTLYAKQGGQLTLTVTTSDDTKCVELTGAHSAVQGASAAKTSWTFNLTAGSSNGLQTVTAEANKNFNQSQNKCTGKDDSINASYVLDNEGPTVTANVSPAANGAGWHNGDVTINWSATDNGSGFPNGPTFLTETITADTAGTTKTANATDRLGNTGTGSVAIKLDKLKPTITGSGSPAANAFGWNNSNVTVSLKCEDGLSGIKTCTGGGSVVLSGEGANQSVAGSAVDNADNSAPASAGPFNIDKSAPSLSGGPTSSPNGAGWYNGDVTIHWAGDDALSGIDPATAPGDSVIGGEGLALTATASVSDKAGNATSATSAAVKIDRTAPTTDAAAPVGWHSSDAAITLNAHDNLSGVASTHYMVDGGVEKTGTSVSVSEEGAHTLEYWSVDKAGNAEATKSIEVNVDKTAPSISAVRNPLANANGWNNTDVTVRFDCTDVLSGVASCTADQVVSEQGDDQSVEGTAVDNAGNSASMVATVSIDKTKPSIEATRSPDANANGWNNEDVTVSFECDDALSGIAFCPAAKTLGEGPNQGATGTARDAADNEASTTVGNIDIDKTPPSLTGAASTSPNANGWNNGDVVVNWTCGDELSEVDGECPADSTVQGEGSDLAANASVSDKAGNTANATVGGIKIDRTVPSTSATVPAPLESGWYAGDVLVTLGVGPDLSGIDKTFYSVDGGAAQEYAGPFNHGLKGVHTITFWSVDKAGNVEDKDAPGHSLTLKIDGVPPTIAGSRAPEGNGFGWNNGPVTVSFTCSDAESGIAGCTDPVTLSNEGADQFADGSALDNAGNSASTRVDGISIDLTAPSLTGAPTTDANAAGWYKDDVAVKWIAVDGLSGIDPATAPADSVIIGEGADLGAGPVSVSDKAGNSTPASVNGIKVDRTAPAINGAPKTAPNAAGWYGGNVVVGFSCTDNLSGVASCPSDELVSGNGADQSVTSDPATDLAGNERAGQTVGGINIDGLTPQTVADNQCTKTNGWCTGSSATVVLNAADQAGLSGVKEIHYFVNDGPEQVAAGASKSVSVPLDGSGKAEVRFFAVDKADNREPLNGVTLEYDNIAPMVTHTLTPSPNANEWNSSDVTVHFEATDNDGGSGVDAASITPDVLVQDETAGYTVTGEAFDVAGNRGIDSVKIKLDKSAPTVTGAVVSGQLGNGGWYVGPVKVHFTCFDTLAGVAVCPDDVTLTTNGANQSVTRQAVDFAGNTASATVEGISIDHEKPTITSVSPQTRGVYTLGAGAAPSCQSTDDVSGILSCNVQVSGGTANGVGEFTYIATATDKAGNQSTQTGSYRVIYRFDGFREPITAPGHQTGATTSVFKAGSNVPVKFQLKRADGTVVQSVGLPVWLTPAKGTATMAPVDQMISSDATSSGATFKWDGEQYHYNWKTEKSQANFNWRIGVQLDDGQVYYANIGLR
jgi:hypothetical protein